MFQANPVYLMEDDGRVQGKPSAAQRSVRAQTEEMEFS